MNDVNTPPTEAVQPKTAKIKKSKKVNAPRAFAVGTILLFIIMFIVIIRLNAKVSSLSDRLTANEEYLAVENSRVYEYAAPDDVLLFEDNTYGEVWLSALENVPLNTHDYSNLVLGDDNRYTYSENGLTTSKTGIDVSYHQGSIDWEAVAADGIDFVIVRLGYRGYESGRVNEDDRAEEYISGALAAGLDVGAYFYSQAITEEEAKEEAEFVIEKLSQYKITYPVVFDWELPDDPNARTADMSSEMLNRCAVEFCNNISAAGYTPMIYSGLKMALCKYDLSGLYQYDFWYVEYKDGHNPPLFPYELQMWQYASDGKVDGINGDVDMNICFVNYPQKYYAIHGYDN